MEHRLFNHLIERKGEETTNQFRNEFIEIIRRIILRFEGEIAINRNDNYAEVEMEVDNEVDFFLDRQINLL